MHYCTTLGGKRGSALPLGLPEFLSMLEALGLSSVSSQTLRGAYWDKSLGGAPHMRYLTVGPYFTDEETEAPQIKSLALHHTSHKESLDSNLGL